MPSKNKAEKSLVKSEKFLKDAKRNFSINSWDGAVILAYLSVFHASRAVLMRDGWREKSHACIARYIEREYVRKNKLEPILIDLLDRFRILRHEDQYDVEFYATQKDANEMIEFAEKILYEIKKLLKTK